MEPDALNEKDAADVVVAQDAEPEQGAAPEQPAEVVELLAEGPGPGHVVAAASAPEMTDEEPLVADVAVPVPADPADRLSDVSDPVGDHSAGWHPEPEVTKEMHEQLLQELADLSGKVALLSTTTAAVTVTIQNISEETEHLVSWSESVKGVGSLSKLFQIATLLVLVLLLGGISWLAVRQYQANHHLHSAEAAVAEAIKIQQKQIMEYDKHFADLVGSEIKKEREASFRVSVQERLNRLRNGLAEQQLYRRNNGDWFAVNGKNEVHVADPDIIQELNQAFVRSGRVLITPYLVPPHKVVSFLRPNGQGGTEIVVTKELAP